MNLYRLRNKNLVVTLLVLAFCAVAWARVQFTVSYVDPQRVLEGNPKLESLEAEFRGLQGARLTGHLSEYLGLAADAGQKELEEAFKQELSRLQEERQSFLKSEVQRSRDALEAVCKKLNVQMVVLKPQIQSGVYYTSGDDITLDLLVAEEDQL